MMPKTARSQGDVASTAYNTDRLLCDAKVKVGKVVGASGDGEGTSGSIEYKLKAARKGLADIQSQVH